MGRHLLVPLDDSDPAQAALDHALTYDAVDRISLLHVVEPSEAFHGAAEGGYYDAERYDRAFERGEGLCERGRERLREEFGPEAVRIEIEVVPGRPSRAIVEYAESHDVDQVVIGSHGRTGARRVLLGSVAETVVRRAPCGVTVVR
ncbi:universal stress protein [Halovivax sp.]|uniref:universal stress protein n=1 Tax=Halovivax sp. TaxID=1935978 RepID=UPI0025C72056|nr:universal stress protein [Halovivax sp.]